MSSVFKKLPALVLVFVAAIRSCNLALASEAENLFPMTVQLKSGARISGQGKIIGLPNAPARYSRSGITCVLEAEAMTMFNDRVNQNANLNAILHTAPSAVLNFAETRAIEAGDATSESDEFVRAVVVRKNGDNRGCFFPQFYDHSVVVRDRTGLDIEIRMRTIGRIEFE